MTTIFIEGEYQAALVSLEQLQRLSMSDCGTHKQLCLIYNDGNSIAVAFDTVGKCVRAYNRVISAWKNLQAGKKQDATH